jgi:hypothetical protein
MRRFALTAVAVAVTACSSAGASPSVSASPTPTRASTPSPSPTAPAVTFDSPLYPYVLTLPPGVARGEWHHATEVWDGVASVSHGAAMTDYIPIDDGDLFAYGTAWHGDLGAFTETVVDIGYKYHGCSPRPVTTDLRVVGVPAHFLTMTCAGQPVARVVLVKDRFGLVVAQILSGGGAAVDRLVERLDDLKWKPS